VAAVVVDVEDDTQAGPLGYPQDVAHAEEAIVVLDRQPRSGPLGEALDAG
jgi:hypothetical protein